jgi:hypothetical protein
MPKGGIQLDDIPTDELLQRAIAAARVGDNDTARSFLTEVTDRSPDNAEAWLWRAGVETQPGEKRSCFERVLALRPGDPEATAGLAALAEKYGSGVLAPDTEVASLYCTWHPDRETLLRCNRCNRPMCTDCAVQHPVGLRCRECVKETRPAMYKVTAAGYAVATVVGLVVGTVAGVVLLAISLVPWLSWILAAVWGGAAGGLQAEAVTRSAGMGQGRKRGPGVQLVGAATLVLGVAVALLWRAGSPERLVAAATLYLLVLLIYLFVALGAVAARLR